MDENKFSHRLEKKPLRESGKLLFWVFFTSIFAGLYSSLFLVSHNDVVNTATPPPIINYQGKLLRDGASVTTAQNMGFLLFDASTGGNLLYTAAGTLAATTTLSITPTSGIFSVDLGTGSTNAIPTSTFANNHTLYLEVHVGGAALSPRKRITAVPYAINSEYLSGLSATTTSGTEYIPRANAFGNFLFTGTPRGSTVADGLLYLNPTSSIDNYTLFGVAAGGTQLLRLDEDGDAFLTGAFFASSSLTIDNGSLFVDASNNRVGVGSTTPFGTLSVSTTSGIPGLVIGSAAGTDFIVSSSGRVGISSTSPQFALSVSGTAYITGTTTIEDNLYVKGKVMRPRHVGSIVNGGSTRLGGAEEVFVQGNYAYVAAYDSDALTIIDVSNPTRLRLVGSTTTEQYLDQASGVYVAGNYAYVGAAGVDRLTVFDVSNPANPIFVTSTPNSAGVPLLDPRTVTGQGNYLYVAANSSNALTIFDISDPTQLRFVGTIANGNGGANLTNPYDVYVSGRYAYVASDFGTEGLEIIDISDPRRPAHAGFYATGANSGPAGVFVQGKYAYMTGGLSNTFYIIDVSNPFNPTLTASIADTASLALNGAEDLFVAGNYAYVMGATDDGIQVIDISSSTAPVAIAQIFNGDGGALLDLGAFSLSRGIFVQGQYLYVCAYNSNALEVIDIGGAVISNADIGSAKVGSLQVLNYGMFDNGVTIRNGLTVGNNGLFLGGDFAMSVPSSTAYLINATNTLTFSHKAMFRASSTNGENFIFDTLNTLASSTSNYLFSVRNNGTKMFSISANGDARVDGNLYASSTVIGTPGSPGDVAERVDVDPDDEITAGDVVVLDVSTSTSIDTYRRSRRAYDPLVVGVISTNPTVTVGRGKTSVTAPLALTGRVPVKISTENGAILRGDLLVAASRPGYAMRYSARTAPTGIPAAILGVALEPFASTSISTASTTDTTTPIMDKIMMLANLSWLNPSEAPLAVTDAPLVTTSTVTTSTESTEEGGRVGELLQGNVEISINTENLIVRDADFHGSIIVRGHTTFSSDSVGQARITAGVSEVRVAFERQYSYQPVITVTPRGEAALLDFKYVVKDESTTGFTIKIDPLQSVAVEFNWHAFGVDRGRIQVSDGTSEDIRIVVGGGSNPPLAAPAPSEPPASPPSEPTPTPNTAPDGGDDPEMPPGEPPPEAGPPVAEEPPPPAGEPPAPSKPPTAPPAPDPEPSP